MATVRVTRDNMPQLERIMRRVARTRVYIGVPGSTSRRGGSNNPLNPNAQGAISNATLGYIHEYGSPARNIPARPFLVPGVDRAKGRLLAVLHARLQKAVDTGNEGEVRNAYETVGIAGAGEVQGYMTSGTFAPLSARTIARKKSSRPLIDTGQLRQSITYVVREDG